MARRRQPGVSKHNKDLEDELGVEIFVRRGVYLCSYAYSFPLPGAGLTAAKIAATLVNEAVAREDFVI